MITFASAQVSRKVLAITAQILRAILSKRPEYQVNWQTLVIENGAHVTLMTWKKAKHLEMSSAIKKQIQRTRRFVMVRQLPQVTVVRQYLVMINRLLMSKPQLKKNSQSNQSRLSKLRKKMILLNLRNQ